MKSVSAPLCGVLTVLVTAVLPSAGHLPDAPLTASPQQTTASYVRVEVWSGRSGWGLVAGVCDRHVTPCPDTLVDEGHTLPPQEAAQPAAPGQGVTLSVLDPRQGTLVFHKVFPLGQYWVHWADLEWHLQRVVPGRVVVMAVAVSGAVGLRHAATRLAALGSLFALHLPPAAHWTWVFVRGGRTLSETVTLPASGAHHAHLLLPLSTLPRPPASDPRWSYCAAHGAMGGLCDEHSPDPLLPPPPAPVAHQAALANVPVVVTAGARHQYLYHTLTALLAAPGALRHNVLVVLGDAPLPTVSLLRLLGLNFTSIAVSGQDNDKLFRYYRAVFRLLERSFPDAPAAILLDEDVEVSPDFFSFFSQTLWLLHADPSLYCINAYSATGFSDRVFHPSRVLRGSVQVQWGYAVTLDFVREALAAWPEDPTKTNIVIYDYWLYTFVRRGRECLYPEYGRVLHYGSGTNAGGQVSERAFLSKPVLREAHVPLVAVERLRQAEWRLDLSRNISEAKTLVGNPCSASFLPEPTAPSQHYVFYYRQDGTPEGGPDVTQSFGLQSCVGGWAFSEQGHTEGVSILNVGLHTTVYLVGVPFSPYSRLRPRHAVVWDESLIPEEEFRVVEANELHRHEFTPVIANQEVNEATLLRLFFRPAPPRPA
ncbi:protein O-linked-mannose beta-1,2-N-acetylglucosaminyltransferase 1-like isoform X1 [Eriocheir sinensis]|uniref:protein O-linked-mannose beta-1,2-N-acetylglucosaminyltransferase 1-like isoform X1 n=1 Tax=Eriocheir sinensis TaxID=95602 RepID=UPI0021C6A4A3|nr:protein O-linked-mannose beta-1,2-N-acetylglucosaminyltransferase 1-like isoform X1 [Eriocheir sinensis]